MQPSDRGTTRPTSMPAEYTTFVDRRDELREARALLGRTRLLTVGGVGGVGKTRFVVRLVADVHRFYPDGVWFLDLSAVTPGGSVADHVATQLGLQAPGRDQEAMVAAFFAERKALLVLDSCEHLIDGAASLVVRLLDLCPALTVIATSRQDLRLSGEAVLLLDPLETPETGETVRTSAMQLFLERCAHLLPDPSETELADIAEICRQLDGVPLSIELAANRVLALSPRQILDRLASPLKLLTGGARDAPRRQQSVTATIEWSYGLCTDEERDLWRRMSVFVGGWVVEAAIASSSAPAEIIDTLQSLVEKSIVQRTVQGDTAVFTMLDAVRRFGLDAASDAELEDARRAHRDWYVERLQAMEAGWYGPDQLAWLTFSRRELPNIRAAVDYCVERGDAATAAVLLVPAWRVVWQAHGRFEELRRRGLEVLALGEIDTPELCQLLVIVGGIECAQGDPETGFAHLDEAAVIAERIGDAFTRSSIPGMHGSVDTDIRSCIAGFERSLELQGSHDMFIARANVEERLALAYDRAGRVDEGRALRSALVRRGVRAGDVFETSYLLLNAGLNACLRGEFDDATSLLRQSLSLKQGLDNPAGLAQVEEALASVAVLGRDFARAVTLLAAADGIWEAEGVKTSTVVALVSRRSEIAGASLPVLGQRAYDAAYERGRAFSLDEGVAFALGATLRVKATSRRKGPAADLSARERQVAALVGQGLSDRQIADALVISRRTAEGHVARSLMKLGFTSRAQLAAWTATEPASG